MSDEEISNNDKTVVSLVKAVENSGSMDIAYAKITGKLKQFAKKYNTYNPKVGDIIKSIEPAYAGKFSSNRLGCVINVYPYIYNDDYVIGNVPTYTEKCNIDVAFIDDEDDLLVFACDSAFFELIEEA